MPNSLDGKVIATHSSINFLAEYCSIVRSFEAMLCSSRSVYSAAAARVSATHVRWLFSQGTVTWELVEFSFFARSVIISHEMGVLGFLSAASYLARFK